MKTFKDSLRDELNSQHISVSELANMTGIKEQKLTYYIKNISYNSLSLHELLIISNVLGKSIYDMCLVKGIKTSIKCKITPTFLRNQTALHIYRKEAVIVRFHRLIYPFYDRLHLHSISVYV